MPSLASAVLEWQVNYREVVTNLSAVGVYVVRCSRGMKAKHRAQQATIAPRRIKLLCSGAREVEVGQAAELPLSGFSGRHAQDARWLTEAF